MHMCVGKRTKWLTKRVDQPIAEEAKPANHKVGQKSGRSQVEVGRNTKGRQTTTLKAWPITNKDATL